MTKKIKTLSRRGLIKAAGAAALIANLPRGGARAAMEPIRIGFPTPLTGPFGAEAKDQVKAATIAIEQFNAAGGLNGRMAELLVRDDKLNPGEAASRTQELIQTDKADFLVGGLSSSVQLAINEVAKAHDMLYISISQSDTINEVKDFGRFTFHEALNPHMTTHAVAHQTFKPGMKIALLSADYAYGHEMATGFKRAAQRIGVDIVAEILHPFGAPDYSPFLPRIQSVKPDLLCLCNFGRDQSNAIKQANDFGVKAQMKIVVPVLLYNQRLATGPEAFEGVVGGANYYWGMEDRVPSAKAFNDAYRAANKTVPSDYAAYGYAGVKALLAAILVAKSTATPAVAAALEQLRYDFYKGPQQYRKCDHQSMQSVLILESKKKSAMKNADDLFDILSIDPGGDDQLRSCSELGF